MVHLEQRGIQHNKVLSVLCYLLLFVGLGTDGRVPLLSGKKVREYCLDTVSHHTN